MEVLGDPPPAEGNCDVRNLASPPGVGGQGQSRRNGVSRQNVHVNPPGTGGGRGVARNAHAAGFHPEHNDPEERFGVVVGAYQAIGGLPEALRNYFNSPRLGPPRRIMDVARDYHEANTFRREAQDDREREFMSSVLDSLVAERDVLVSLQSPTNTGAGGASEEGESGDGRQLLN